MIIDRVLRRLPYEAPPARAIRAVRRRRFERRLAGRRLLRAFAKQYPEAVFVEIGANDGKQHDHLRGFITSGRWRGVLVEPVPHIFEELRKGYAGVDRVVLENAAIADCDGTLPFYHLIEVSPDERDGLPGWYDGLGSFNRDAILSHRNDIPDIDRRLVEREVPCLTFDSLVAKHALDRVDLLLTDTEGYDWEIIKGLDLQRHKPRLLIYEHYHFSPEVRRECREHLQRAGYEAMEEWLDTFCLLPANDALTRVWRRLEPGVPPAAAYEEQGEALSRLT